MKKIVVLLSLLFVAMVSYADEQQKISLDEGHAKEQVRLGYCNVFVTKDYSDAGRNDMVTLEIENLDETNTIILFGHAFPEKELKKLSPSIKFDKKFPGTKGHRNIDTYREVRNVLFVEPSEKCLLPGIQIRSGEVRICRLPLYIAKYKNNRRNSLLLMEKQVLELEIEVKPDADFIRLESECNDLMEEIGKQTFCTNRKHRPSLEKQKTPYIDKITSIKSEIDEIVSRHQWIESDGGYQRYSALKQRLDTIDFTPYEGDCGNAKNHRTGSSNASCKFCNLSPQQIYHKLDDYYKMIYNSNDRKATKESVMADVNLLYGCRKHSALWKKSEYNKKITDRFNRISNF